jgi:hypothetical protein
MKPTQLLPVVLALLLGALLLWLTLAWLLDAITLPETREHSRIVARSEHPSRRRDVDL